jgi:signal transduction histidine kinase
LPPTPINGVVPVSLVWLASLMLLPTRRRAKRLRAAAERRAHDIVERAQTTTLLPGSRAGDRRLVDGFLIGDRDTTQPVAPARIRSDSTPQKRTEAALRERERELRALLDERARLSEDLHDNVIQLLYATGMQLEECRRRVEDDAGEVGRSLEAAIRTLNSVIRDLRRYIIGDHPSGVTGESFLAALEDLRGMIAAPHVLNFRLQVEPAAALRLSPQQAQHLLSIAREAVSNTLRHARARNATLALEVIDGGVRLQLEDDGDGFDAETDLTWGRGLVNMRLRACKLGARFAVASRPGSGTRIMLLVRQDLEHGRA